MNGAAPPLRKTNSILGQIAVWGPGLLVMLADTDAGNVVTSAQAGATWGYRFLPLLLLIALGTTTLLNPKVRAVVVGLAVVAGLVSSAQNVTTQRTQASQVAAAINIVIQLSRISDGSRKLTHISEGLGMDLQGNYKTNDIYLFEQTGRDVSGKVLGGLNATGNLPSFMREIEVNHLPFPREMFTRKNGNGNGSPPKPEDHAA